MYRWKGFLFFFSLALIASHTPISTHFVNEAHITLMSLENLPEYTTLTGFVCPPTTHFV